MNNFLPFESVPVLVKAWKIKSGLLKILVESNSWHSTQCQCEGLPEATVLLFTVIVRHTLRGARSTQNQD